MSKRRRKSISSATVTDASIAARFSSCHFAHRAPAVFNHAFLIGGNTTEHLPGFFIFLNLAFAIGLKAPMLDDVVKHCRPLGGFEFALQSFGA